MNYLIRIFLVYLALLNPLVSLGFPLDEIEGRWGGDTITAYYRGREPIPIYYTIAKSNVFISENGMFSGEFSNGCMFKGQIMRSSSKQFPLRGFMGNCEEKRLNGRFDGMFNTSGQIRMIIRDKKLGRGDFFGKLKQIHF